jgi:hypothetical protein
MNPELQTVVDRLELVERQNSGWKIITLLALALAAAAVALPFMKARPVGLERGRFSVLEADRIQLRAPDGSVAAELACQANGSAWFLLGRRATGCAQLVVLNGRPSLILAESKDRLRIVLDGSERPGLYLTPEGTLAGMTMRADATRGGEISVRDLQGRTRFHAP